MLDRLIEVESKYRELESLLADPAIIADIEKYRTLSQEHASLAPVARTIARYRKISGEIQEAKAILEDGGSDRELRDMAADELSALREEKDRIEADLPRLLLPKDPNDDKSVIVEIRGGVGGEEAALFAADLFRMYSRYAERRGWQTEIIEANETELGGFKSVSFSIEGYGAFSRMKYERGTHRVQRVPATESQGRIQTSAVTVAVLPEAGEVELDIRPDELRIDTYCASGAGGQYVNRTETAIRITHLPTGMVVTCQDEKSQRKNKDKAMLVLRARLYEKLQAEQNDALARERKEQIGTGDRSQRIRTYNFPQGRVTDHRIGLTLHRLEEVIAGDLDELINALITADQTERLKKNHG